MLFNSSEYLFLFLPFAAAIFFSLGRSDGGERRMAWLVLASLVFYGSWKPVYLLLILASVLTNFALGRQIASSAGVTRHRWLVCGVVFNLALLAYFKYAGFFVESLNAIGQWLIPVPEITLPLAISFFTFQQIAYLVDVARDDCEEYQLRHYALFVLFFPQLIAGPIVHHREMMPQFQKPTARHQLSVDFSVGLTFIAIGLFKKVVLADSLALVADPVFDAGAGGRSIHTLDAWLATLAFSFQIYFDFSGYTDIAIGSARIFGIRLPENFRSPYKASSIIEIWRRWHMTLSRFLRDYLYIALGGNRNGRLQRYRNLVLTMLIGGLWHGAAWTYVIWGGMHGLYLCINHAWRYWNQRLGTAEFFARASFRPLFVILTFLAWSLAMVVFRAENLQAATALMEPLLSMSSKEDLLLTHSFSDTLIRQGLDTIGATSAGYALVYATLLASAAICWGLPNSQQYLYDYKPVLSPKNDPLPPATFRWRPGAVHALGAAICLSVAILGLSAVSRFIYFQF